MRLVFSWQLFHIWFFFCLFVWFSVPKTLNGLLVRYLWVQPGLTVTDPSQFCWQTDGGVAIPAKGTGAFSFGFAQRAVAVNAWSRSRSYESSPHPLFGAGACGAEEQPSQVTICIRRYQRERVSVWVGFSLMMLPLSLHLSSILRLTRLRRCQTAGSNLCFRSLCY